VLLVSATRRPTVLYAHYDRDGRPAFGRPAFGRPATKGPDALPGGSQSPPTDFRWRRRSSPGRRQPSLQLCRGGKHFTSTSPIWFEVARSTVYRGIQCAGLSGSATSG